VVKRLPNRRAGLRHASLLKLRLLALFLTSLHLRAKELHASAREDRRIQGSWRIARQKGAAPSSYAPLQQQLRPCRKPLGPVRSSKEKHGVLRSSALLLISGVGVRKPDPARPVH
jgi:hypothetical protein